MLREAVRQQADARDQAGQRPLKILWFSLRTYYDRGSVRASRVRTMLKALTERGCEVRSLTCIYRDYPTSTTLPWEDFPELKISRPAPNVIYTEDGPLGTSLIVTQERDLSRLGGADLSFIIEALKYHLRAFSPDVVLGSDIDNVSEMLRREVRLAGLPYVYVLMTSLNRAYEFADCAMVVTASRTTAYGLNAAGARIVTAGPFIKKEAILATERRPTYVTLINSSFSKGLSVFVRLALVCHRERLPVRFLVVQTRGRFFQVIKALRWSDGSPLDISARDLPNVEVVDNPGDLRSIFAMTRLLLMPSLWNENFGHYAIEAIMNGIPVVCTDSGGLPEAIAGAGLTVELPRACMEDMTLMPTFEDIRLWYDALHEALTRDFTAEIAHAQAVNALEKSTERLMNALTELLDSHLY